MSIESFLIDYVQKFVDENELHHYIRRFNVSGDTNDKLGVFNTNMGILTINYGSIIEYVNNNFSLVKNLSINEFLTYKLFDVLYHELRHVYQRKEIDLRSDIGELLYETWPTNDEVKSGFYINNHGLYPNERDANLFSSDVLSRILEPKFSELISLEERNCIGEGYDKSYPLKKLCDKKDIVINYDLFNLSLYEKLVYGFPLNKEELEIFREALLSSKKDSILVKKIVNK